MSRRSGATIVAVALVTALSPISGAAAYDDDDESEFTSAALDDGFEVANTNFLAPTIDDTTTTVSDTTVEQVTDAITTADVMCDFRKLLPDADEEEEFAELEDEECEGGPTEAEIVAATSTAFRTLSLNPQPITYQPDGTWALVNIDFVVYTEPQAQTLDSEVFGIPISIRATPVSYTWDFGDGTTLTTTDPGQPYPSQTVAHVYSSAADAVTVTLTTTYRGEFTYDGAGGWLPIAGLASATSTTPPVEIVAMDVNLVPNS